MLLQKWDPGIQVKSSNNFPLIHVQDPKDGKRYLLQFLTNVFAGKAPAISGNYMHFCCVLWELAIFPLAGGAQL